MTGRQNFSSRLIDLSGMDKPLRRVLLVGYAVLLGLSLAAAVKQFLPGPEVVASPGIRLQSGAVAVAALATLTAVYFVLSGAAQLRSLWRLAFIVPVGAVGLAIAYAQPVDSLRTFSLVAAIVFAASATAVLVYGPRPNLEGPIWRAAAIVAAIAIFVAAVSAIASPAYAPTLAFLGLGMLVMPLAPALMTVGYDLGEICAFTVVPQAKRLGVRSGALKWIVPFVVLIATSAFAVWVSANLVRFEAIDLAARVAIIGGFASVAAWAIWARFLPASNEPAEIGYWQIFALAVGVLIVESVAEFFPIQPAGYFSYEGSHQFSVPVSDGWSVSPKSKRPAPELDGNPIAMMRRVFEQTPGKFPRLVVTATIGPTFARPEDVPELLNDIEGGQAIAPLALAWNRPDTDGWKHGEQLATVVKTGKTLRMLYWRKDIQTPAIQTDKTWYVVCVLALNAPPQYETDCRTMVAKLWYLPRKVHDPLAEFWFNQAYWFGFAACGLALLRIRGQADALLWLAIWCAVVSAARNFGIHGVGITDILRDRDLIAGVCASVLILASISLAVAQVAAVATGSSLWRAISDVAQSFAVTTTFLTLVFFAYTVAAQGSDYSDEIRGTILCLGVTWELWTSGSTVTNRDDTNAPRSARVRMFAGYLILVATATFFFTGMKVDFSNANMEAWDADGLAMQGLCVFGFAYALMRHVERLARTLPARSVAVSEPSETLQTP